MPKMSGYFQTFKVKEEDKDKSNKLRNKLIKKLRNKEIKYRITCFTSL